MSKTRRQASATTTKEIPITSFTSIDRDIRLIEAVKGHPVLYDPSITGYKDHRTKESMWEIVGAEVDGLSDDCRNRWRALRDRFVREKKALLLGQKESTFTGRKPKTWPLIDAMSFLWEFIMHRSSRGVQGENVYASATLTDDQLVKLEGNAASELTMEDDLEMDETEEEVIEWVMEPAEAKRARQGSVSPPSIPIVTSASSLAMPQLQVEKPPPPLIQQDEADDEDSLFCKSVAHTLRRLAPRRKALAKLRILQALYDAEFGNHLGPDVEVRLRNDPK
ncbi:hypothetical protein B566_EDAN008142 [Ephemera danica]|nr:hypothetical protein B566_EDAN008142 [Ephemera danica]